MTPRQKKQVNGCDTCKFWQGSGETIPHFEELDVEEEENVAEEDPCALHYWDTYKHNMDSDCPQWQKWTGKQ